MSKSKEGIKIIIMSFTDFFNKYKNPDPPKGFETIVNEFVESYASQPEGREESKVARDIQYWLHNPKFVKGSEYLIEEIMTHYLDAINSLPPSKEQPAEEDQEAKAKADLDYWYPCKPDIFEKTYEPENSPTEQKKDERVKLNVTDRFKEYLAMCSKHGFIPKIHEIYLGETLLVATAECINSLCLCSGNNAWDVVKKWNDENKRTSWDAGKKDAVEKKGLVDFFVWFRNEGGESHIGLSVEKMIDEYLKSKA